MSKCDRCGKEHYFMTLDNEFGYKILCADCEKELVEKRDIKTVDELIADEVHKLDGRQTVKNFVKYFIEYQKEPNGKTLDALWRLFCWACHEDHTASCAISEIMKWQSFKFVDEWEKFEQ